MSRYNTYRDYKNSGHPWLTEIPAHWHTKKLKFLANCFPSNVDKKTKDGEQPIFLCNYTDVYYNDEISHELDFMKASATDEQIKKFILKKDDVIITKDSEDPNDIAVPAVVKSDMENVVCGYHLAMIRPNKHNNGRFLKRVFESRYARSTFATSCNGLTRYGLGSYAIDNATFPMPPREEQTQIAAFLDRETAKIDQLIDKQLQLIKLLEEKRQAVISHAVTKGLNPDAPMKDSCVEWLGQVPEHWEVMRLKHTSEIIDCKNRTPEYFDDGKFLVVRTTNVKNQKLITEGALYTDKANFKVWTQRGIPPANSILFTREAPAGEVCFVPEDVQLCMGQRMMNFIPYDEEYSNFLFDFLVSDCLTRYIQSESMGSTVSHLRVEQVYNIPVVIPPSEERDAIHKYLSSTKRKFERLRNAAEQAIKLMQERRTALISAAVTGKIDVRNQVTQDEIEAVAS